MSERLLPCPFCGGTPFVQPNGRLGFEYWEVVCDTECDFTGPARDTKEQAAEAWNRRAPITQEYSEFTRLMGDERKGE